MSKKLIILIVTIVSLYPASFAEFPNAKMRKAAISFMSSNDDLSVYLHKPVEVRREESGVLRIIDPGSYLVQYMILTPDSKESSDPNISITLNTHIPTNCNKALIVTHGWIDKGQKDWPADIANATLSKTDPNEWTVAYFDWKTGAAVLNPVDAARYSRDIAGTRLAGAFLALLSPHHKLEHVHLIAHSAGVWAATSAAEIIAKQTGARIHLTLLDAYIPPKWDEKTVGKVESAEKLYTEHYYTKDITLNVTHTNLTAAHNVDLSDVQPGIKTHEFPYRWYYATITGKFRKKDGFKNKDLVTKCSGIEYGFQRSLEASPENFEKSLKLKTANKAVKIKKPGKQSIFDPSTWFKENIK